MSNVIPMRIAHLVGSMKVSAATSSMLNISRWLAQHDHQPLILTEGGDRYDEADQDRLDVMTYQPSGASWLFGGRKQFVAQVTDWKPDVIHVHRLACLPLALRLSGGELPIVCSVHGEVTERHAELVGDAAVQAVVVANEFMRSSALRWLFAQQSVSQLFLMVYRQTVLPLNHSPVPSRL